jgi:hypothetical protein
MVRWAQRRVRGGGGGPTTAPAPTPVSIVDVHADGTDWVLTFSGPVSCNTATADANFLVGDATFFQCDGAAGSLASGSDDGSAGYVPGLAWNLTAQPAWLNTPIAGPQTGTTT